MQIAQNELVPLTADEQNFLLGLFYKRRKLLYSAYAFLILLAAVHSRRIDRGSDSTTGRLIRWEDTNNDSKFVSRLGMIMINFCFLESMIVSTGIYFFRKRVRPLKQDADSGVKEKVPYTIVRKEYFPITNQYYVAFDDVDYMHHQVDEDTYNNSSEGDTFYIYRAIKSKFIFEDSGRYTVL